jgi:serine protease
VSGLSGAVGDVIAFRVPLPAGKTSLSVISYGGTGNVSLFGADGRPASRDSYDVASTRQGNSETIRFTALVGNAVYFILSGEAAFSGVSVRVQ